MEQKLLKFEKHRKFQLYTSKYKLNLVIISKLRIYTFHSINKHLPLCYPRIKFTIEQPTINTIKFLDTTITVGNYTLINNWYRNPAWSGRYLNFMSYLPLKYEKSVIKGLVDRAVLLSHSRYHKPKS